MFTTAAFQYLTRRQDGCACFTSAATPATLGAAIEVPDIVAERLPVPIPTDASATPGAVRSGLSQLSPERGPNELKLARFRKPGFAIVVLVSVADPPSAAIRAGVALPCTPRNGIVTVNCSPVSGFWVI